MRRFSGSVQAVYYALAVVCGDGPRVLSAEQIGFLSGLSTRTTVGALRVLIDGRFVVCVPIRKRGGRDRFTGRYDIADPAKFAGMDSPKRTVTLTA